MSHENWGTFITSRPTRAEALRAVFEFNKLLAKMQLPDEVKLGVIFDIHYTYDNRKGRNWHHAVYLRLDDRAEIAIQMLSEYHPVSRVRLRPGLLMRM